MVNSVAELVPYDPEVTEIAARYSEAIQRLFTKALTQNGVKAPAKTKQTPEQLAAYVFNTIQGLRILIKSGAAREKVQAISSITLNNLK